MARDANRPHPESRALLPGGSRPINGLVKLPSAQLKNLRFDFRVEHPEQELQAYVRRFRSLGSRAGVELEELGTPDLPYPVLRLRATRPRPVKVLLTATNHGNERVGAPAALRFVDWLLTQPELRQRVDVTVIPFLSPEPFSRNARKNAEKQDPNRRYRPGSDSAELAQLTRALKSRHFDLAIDLHSAFSMDSFFIIGESRPGQPDQLLPDVKALVTAAGKALRGRVPLANKDRATMDVWVDGRATGERKELPYHRIDRGIYSSTNPGTLKSYLAQRGTPATFTVEAPRSLGYRQGVDGLVAVVRALIDARLAQPPR